MSYEPKIFTIGHIVIRTGIVALVTAGMYVGRHKDDHLVWFMENWGLYIGIVCTILTFLIGLTIIGTPWYDEETDKQLKADHDQAVFEWNQKSPEERAILNAARQNQLLQLAQIMQNDRIIRNQEKLTRKRQD